MKSWFGKLSQPYYQEYEGMTHLIRALVFGAFVTTFLFVFTPFGLSGNGIWFFLVCAGFGLITTFCMILLNVAMPRLLTGLFKEETWSVGKEIFWTMCNLSLIGLGNYAFFTLLWGTQDTGLHSLLYFQLYTWALGIIPVTIYTLIKERKAFNQFDKEAKWIDTHMEPSLQISKIPSLSDATITLTSTTSEGSLNLKLTDFLAVQSADNYVEVFYIKDDQLQKHMLRNTLKQLESDLAEEKEVMRTHKSYIVNLKQVTHIFGNAQGYKLVIPSLPFHIPVSRALNHTVKEKLTI
jgi:hypothetical protein